MNSPDPSWLSANYRYMTAAISRIHEDLLHLVSQQRGTSGDGAAEDSRQRMEEIRRGMPAPPALDRLCGVLGISAFERYVLLLCAAVESDVTFPSLCAMAQGGEQFIHPTLNLALSLFPEEVDWSSFLPLSPLRYWGLVEVGYGETFGTSPLRIDERILHHLAGADYIDVRLRAYLREVFGDRELPASQRSVVERIVQLWSREDQGSARPIVHLSGIDVFTIEAIATLACGRRGSRLLALRASDIPAPPADRDQLARLIDRETKLFGAALLIVCDDADAAHLLRVVVPFLDALTTLVIISGRDRLSGGLRPIVRFDVGKPTPAEQRALWHTTLGGPVEGFNGQVEAVVSHFNLGANAVRAAGAQAREMEREEGGGLALWEACRLQARPRLDNLAQRIEASASWEDLVLPEHQLLILREIAAHVRRRATVYEQWGFAGKGGRGLGISAMFAGPSGTGKTMAAEVLARELHLDLYHIDLSQIVSKYIGETEKNLSRVFDAAEEGGAILLFDEADALFGKRSDVKDSHDRYANVEVSYLLQRMEAYRGLAVLTTNMKQALDTAFLRRIRFIVQFPFPEPAQRSEIWRRVFPAATPVGQIDLEKLARLNIAGGNIRNIALNAAFLAADEGSAIDMRHLHRAAKSEYAKLEKPLTEIESGGWE